MTHYNVPITHVYCHKFANRLKPEIRCNSADLATRAWSQKVAEFLEEIIKTSMEHSP